MKKVLIILGLLLLCLFVGSVSAMSGSGTASDPYILTTSADLVALSGTGLAGYGANAYYELGADIDMSSVASFTPIGTGNYLFAGHFDGKNHSIIGLYGSLIYSISESSVISNIIFKNCTCNNVYNYNCGILAPIIYGATFNNIQFENCIVLSNSACTGLLGGVVYDGGTHFSMNDCVAINCYLKGSPDYQIGGFIGWCFSNTAFNNCILNKCTITGGTNVGGIFGSHRTLAQVNNCTVSDCALIGTSYVSGVGN